MLNEVGRNLVFPLKQSALKVDSIIYIALKFFSVILELYDEIEIFDSGE